MRKPTFANIRVYAVGKLVGSMVLLTGCSSILPGSGPSADMVGRSSLGAQGQSYELFDLDVTTAHALKQRRAHRISRLADGQGPVDPLIGVGDVLRVTIWEAAPGGLFTSQVNLAQGTGSQSVTIPEQVVTQNGTISVPFVGAPRVLGMTARAVEKTLQQRLTGKAVDPQVLVTIVRSSSSAVTITGDAIGGAQLPLGPNGYRVLDAVASVGGIRTPLTETFVSLTRNGQTAEIPFGILVTDPNENIFLRPRDVLSVVRKPVTFTVLGATGRNAEVNFEAPALSLAQALGKAGGLADFRADATGVFVLRREAASDVIAMGRHSNLTALGVPVPVIYRLDLSATGGLIAAQSFQMQPGDLIYVSNAPATEFEKFLRLISATRSAVD